MWHLFLPSLYFPPCHCPLGRASCYLGIHIFVDLLHGSSFPRATSVPKTLVCDGFRDLPGLFLCSVSWEPEHWKRPKPKIYHAPARAHTLTQGTQKEGQGRPENHHKLRSWGLRSLWGKTAMQYGIRRYGYPSQREALPTGQ